MRALAVLVAAVLGLAGCAGLSLPADPTKMQAEQLREWVKDKSANVQCGVVSTPYKGQVVAVNLDKGLVPNGEVVIEDGCKITIRNVMTAPR